MRVIFDEMKSFKKEMILIIVTSIISSFFSMGIPRVMQRLIDEAIPTHDYGLVFFIAGQMIIFLVIIVVAGIIGARNSSYVSMGIGRNMRNKIFAKVQEFSEVEIDNFSASSLISRTNSDITQVQTFLSTCLRTAILTPLFAVAGIVMTLVTSPRLVWILIVAVPIMIICILLIGRCSIPLAKELQIKLDTINRVIREKLTGVRVIRAFGTIDFENKRFDKINTEYEKMDKKVYYVTNLLRPLAVLGTGGTMIAILMAPFMQYLNGDRSYTVGMLVSVMSYVSLIMVAVMYLTIVLLLLPKAATCARRAKEVIDTPIIIKDPENAKTSSDKRGYLTFKNVSFTYKGADVPAIKDLSFEAKPGETTAIIGGTGMGKSTIVNLIPRLYDVTEGEILVDDVNVKDYKLSDLRSKIGFVPQKALLFKGTIDSNLAFGDDKPTEQRIEKAAKIAQAYDFILKKEKGFDDPVAQGGTNFSGGQRQRLCIARAIVRKPEIYVFDDSFSALDLKTDKLLREALKKETGKDATTVIIAQRVSTILDADRIIVVDMGEVVGIGTHHELLKTCDVYKEIVASQMSAEEANHE